MANQRTDSKGSGTLRVTLLRRPMDKKQRETVIGLGLRRIRHSVEVKDTPSSRGMIHKVRHLVEVAE